MKKRLRCKIGIHKWIKADTSPESQAHGVMEYRLCKKCDRLEFKTITRQCKLHPSSQIPRRNK